MAPRHATTTVRRRAPLVTLVLVASACGAAGAESAPGVNLAPATSPPPTTSQTTTTSSTTTSVPATTTTVPATTTTTTPPTTTTSPTTTTPPTTTTTTVEPLPSPSLPATNQAFDRMAAANPAVSMTVVRDGTVVFSRASGQTLDGQPAHPDSPMVVASVSKLVTATALARLSQQELIDPDQPVPWADIGVSSHPGWSDVTIRELLDHESGMPVARSSWFRQPGDCADHLPSLLQGPPLAHRGEWTYSNGNYCALGLLIEQRTGLPLDVAAQQLVFDPLGAEGVHLTVDGLLPADVPHDFVVERLARLGGAGTFVVSTEDVARMLSSVNEFDRWVIRFPGVFVDQYGWGHTGTVDGAKACAWVIEDGRTAIAATIAGSSPSTGGRVCDIVLPALADDLGIGAGTPDRQP